MTTLDSSTIMQIIIAGNIFIMGILVVIGIRHAIAHFKSKDNDENKVEHIRRPRPKAQVVRLPDDLRDKLIESSKTHFQAVLNRSATTLERDLKTTTTKLTKQMDKIGSNIILTEMKRYRSDLEAMRKQAESIIEEAQRDVVEHQSELKAELAKRQSELEIKLRSEIEAEKQELSRRLNTSLSDAVSAFLIETMKHEVDLGSQAEYITKVLDEHKAELIKEIMDEA